MISPHELNSFEASLFKKQLLLPKDIENAVVAKVCNVYPKSTAETIEQLAAKTVQQISVSQRVAPKLFKV